MPVYDHRYRGFTGERRSGRFRVWTVARFALADLWKSRLALLLLPILIYHSLQLLGGGWLAGRLAERG